MALVLKTSDVKASVGSNPTLSVPKTLRNPASGWVFLYLGPAMALCLWLRFPVFSGDSKA